MFGDVAMIDDINMILLVPFHDKAVYFTLTESVAVLLRGDVHGEGQLEDFEVVGQG